MSVEKVEFLLSDFEGIEEPPCSNSLSCGGLDRKQREDHPCYQVEVQGIVGDESLNAAQIGVTLNRSRHCRSQLVKAHSLHHAKCMEHISHKLNASQIHRISKILLHNREDLVNFDQVLGISSLHRKSSELFFKVTDFQGFLQM